jgi:hypothetical protein
MANGRFLAPTPKAAFTVPPKVLRRSPTEEKGLTFPSTNRQQIRSPSTQRPQEQATDRKLLVSEAEALDSLGGNAGRRNAFDC